MNKLEKRLAIQLGASSVVRDERIQSLWSGYGEIVRYVISDAQPSSIIIKHVKIPENVSHPRGWNTDTSNQRKIRSFEVESNWYQYWSSQCDSSCRVAKSYFVDVYPNEFLIAMEDLDQAGFSRRVQELSIADIQLCLTWLANFHAKFMNISPEISDEQKLWEIGTYWHLATRPDELAAMEDKTLRIAAKDIDAKLNACRYQTWVHGDAKLANFCFDEKGDQVAAVDFQYVGGGCGMKDVMLLLSSALDSEQCFKDAQDLLDYYFKALKKALVKTSSSVNFAELEKEWRTMYIFAWADFIRFVKGWSPGHWKIHEYSEKMTDQAIEIIKI